MHAMADHTLMPWGKCRYTQRSAGQLVVRRWTTDAMASVGLSR